MNERVEKEISENEQARNMIGNNIESDLKIADISFSDKMKRFGPIALFLPIIILVSSDAALLLTNQIQIVISFDTNMSFIGAIVGISLITKAISTLIFGYASDKYSRKKILIIGGIIWSFGELAVSLSPNKLSLLIFRVIASIGAGATTPVTMSLLADIFSSEKRGKSFAWFGIATMIGDLAGGMIGLMFNPIQSTDFPASIITFEEKINYLASTFPIEVIELWRKPFLIMFVLGLIFVTLIFLIKEPKRGGSESALRDILSDEDVNYEDTYKIKKEDLKYIYTRKSNFWLIINFVDTIFSGLLLGFLITWLTLEVELSFTLEDMVAVLPFVLILAFSLIFGQLFFAKIGDKKYTSGDYAGRVKVAVFCGIVQIPFLILGFLFAPNASNKTFFKGSLDLSGNSTAFMLVFILMAVVLGLGISFWMGVGPNWYSSMLDVNLPEHRGTMIATAAFMDAIGRAIGAWLGGALITYFTYTRNSIAPITDTIIFTILTVGVLSALLWIPILKYCKKDFEEVATIIKERAQSLSEKSKIGKN